MCGIFGIFSPNPEHYRTAAQQLNTLEHRGPDDQGSWQGRNVYVGMRRLSIIDLSGGHQPIWNEAGTCCIVYNGELYNFMDLRPELEARGHIFKTHTDTEVILHAYEEWGPECLRRCNGMFAIAIWDELKQRLFLARDRLGEKPLYYYQGGDRLVFASEIKAIVADPTIPRQLNNRGLANFLALAHAVAPATIYQNIYKLLPGHYLTAEARQIEIKQYWDVGDDPQIEQGLDLGQDEFASRILSLLDDSVQRRMVADVPVGAFLSGGVDSSAIAALMKRHATGPVKTFSLGFSDAGYNELSEARSVAKYLGTEHYELNAGSEDLVGLLQKLIYHYDEPFGDAANFPVYLVSQLAREHVKVVLAGEGADELFGGYRRYAYDQFAGFYQKLPGILTQNWLPRLIGRIPRIRRVKRTLQTLPIADPARRCAAWLQAFSPEMLEQLFCPDLLTELGDYDPTWSYPHYYYKKRMGRRQTDHINQMMYLDLKTLMVDGLLEKVDKASMACSLEGRLPFLDHRLVELAFQIPSRYKIQGLSTKVILKQAVKSLIPAEVLKRPKHGFAVPTDPWFRGPLKDFVFEVLTDDRARGRGYFNIAYIERLYRLHREGAEVNDTTLWLLLNFELWCRMYLDKSGL